MPAPRSKSSKAPRRRQSDPKFSPKKPGPKRVRFANCLHCGNDAGRKNTRFCSNACQAAHRWKQTAVRIEASGKIDTGFAPAVTARRYMKECFGHACQSCGLKVWQDKPIPLVLDHIDGNSDNWRVDNLRLICPNCDALTPTYKNRNKGKGRHLRRARYAAGLSY